jgi:hypothetical protein
VNLRGGYPARLKAAIRDPKFRVESSEPSECPPKCSSCRPFLLANKVLAKENVPGWKLQANKYYYIPAPPIGLAGIVVEPTDDLLRLQQELLEAIAPYAEKAGTPAAFMSTEEGRDIQQSLIEYVANFATVAAGTKFNPHVTIGVGTEVYLKEMLAEPFEAFKFSPVGASVYQLGAFGTARHELKALNVSP